MSKRTTKRTKEIISQTSEIFSNQLTSVGDYSEEVTPVPIPNTVVKLLSAENTWRGTARENMTSPALEKTLVELTSVFLVLRVES